MARGLTSDFKCGTKVPCRRAFSRRSPSAPAVLSKLSCVLLSCHNLNASQAPPSPVTWSLAVKGRTGFSTLVAFNSVLAFLCALHFLKAFASNTAQKIQDSYPSQPRGQFLALDSQGSSLSLRVPGDTLPETHRCFSSVTPPPVLSPLFSDFVFWFFCLGFLQLVPHDRWCSAQ